MKYYSAAVIVVLVLALVLYFVYNLGASSAKTDHIKGIWVAPDEFLTEAELGEFMLSVGDDMEPRLYIEAVDGSIISNNTLGFVLKPAGSGEYTLAPVPEFENKKTEFIVSDGRMVIKAGEEVYGVLFKDNYATYIAGE